MRGAGGAPVAGLLGVEVGATDVDVGPKGEAGGGGAMLVLAVAAASPRLCWLSRNCSETSCSMRKWS